MNTESGTSRAERNRVLIEAGGEWLKILVVSRSGDATTIQRGLAERYDPAVGITPDQFSAAMRRLEIKPCPVTACLSRQHVTLRLLELPSIRPEELRDMVDLQLSKQTPMTRDEVSYDHKVLGPGRQGYSKVMVSIVQRNVLRQRFSLIEGAGFSVRRMSISTEGVFQWFRNEQRKGPAEGPAVILDVDAGATDMLVADGDMLHFSRSISVGAQAVKTEGAAAAERLSAEVRLCLEAFRAEMPGITPLRVILTGASAAVGNAALESALKGRLGLPVSVLHCMEGMKSGSKFSAEAIPDVVSLAGVAGLAGERGRAELNLVPESVRMKEALVFKARQMTRFAVLVVTGMVFLSMLGAFRVMLAGHRLERLSATLADVEPRARSVAHMKELTRVLRVRTDVRRSPLSVLSQIHAAKTSAMDVTLEQLDVDMDKGTVTISGSSASTEDIRRLVQNLEASVLFKDVQEGGETGMNSRTRRYQFRLNMALEAVL